MRLLSRFVDYVVLVIVFVALMLDAAVTELRARLGLVACDSLFVDCMWYLGSEELCRDYIARTRCRR